MKKRPVLLIVIIGLIIIAVIASVIFFIGKSQTNNSIDEITSDLSDEFSRAKYFISDWYNELCDSRGAIVYLNEVVLQGGRYSLTYASGRIRAVYPRGERFFKLDRITSIEFFEVDSILRCRFSYGENGEYMFRVG